MKIKKIRFISSSIRHKDCPQPGYPEFAFCGRSNVGKSSLINMLVARRNMAKVSQTPGRTQTINHFLVNDAWYLVDLPGYGFAKVSKSKRKANYKVIEDYLLNRSTLICLFVLIDSQLEPQNIDLKFIEWLGINRIPFVICFTKTDKLSPAHLEKNINNFKNILSEKWEYIPQIFISSAVKNTGKNEILNFIEKLIK